MKISVDVDCTPEEARTFLGLPDLKPVQDAVLQQVQDRMVAALGAMDPETLMKTWLPAQVQGMEHLQKMFWAQFAGGRRPKSREAHE